MLAMYPALFTTSGLLLHYVHMKLELTQRLELRLHKLKLLNYKLRFLFSAWKLSLAQRDGVNLRQKNLISNNCLILS